MLTSWADPIIRQDPSHYFIKRKVLIFGGNNILLLQNQNSMKLALLIFFHLIFGTISVSGQFKVCHRTTAGTDFWFGFMDNAIILLDFQDCIPNKLSPLHYGEIIVTSEFEADFTIAVGPSQTPYGGIYHVNAHKSLKVQFDVDANRRNAIHLTSLNNPVSVYALNFSEYTSDIAMIYPTASLGKEYFAMCCKPDPVDVIMFPLYIDNGWVNGGWGRESTSEFLIVATVNGTTVKITPSAKINSNLAPIKITLNMGEQYMVASSDTLDGPADLTGSYIVSNHPIALFSGGTWTQIPSGTSGSPGHLYEQMPALQTWGRKFIAVPFSLKCRDTWRVLASMNGTTVHVTGKHPVTLNRGQFSEFNLEQTEPSLIESDKPVLVAQYSSGNLESCGSSSNKPSMVIVSPVNQASERTAFVTYEYVPWSNSVELLCNSRNGASVRGYFNEKPDISNCLYFINVIARDNAAGKINLDDVPITFHSLSGTGYGYAQVPISVGSHLIESIEPGNGFVAMLTVIGIMRPAAMALGTTRIL